VVPKEHPVPGPRPRHNIGLLSVSNNHADTRFFQSALVGRLVEVGDQAEVECIKLDAAGWKKVNPVSPIAWDSPKSKRLS